MTFRGLWEFCFLSGPGPKPLKGPTEHLYMNHKDIARHTLVPQHPLMNMGTLEFSLWFLIPSHLSIL